MWRLVLVTFAVLGFAFYELSGGDTFEPEQKEAFSSEIVPEPKQSETAIDQQSADQTPIAEAEGVDASEALAFETNTEASAPVNPKSDTAALDFELTSPAPQDPAPESFIHLAAYGADTTLKEGTNSASEAETTTSKGEFFEAVEAEIEPQKTFSTGAEIEQFWQQVAQITSATETRREAIARLTPASELRQILLGDPNATAADLLERRVVRGNRVNMRTGPGTKHAVINQLNLGDEVEIIEDSGAGWVRLRPLKDQTQTGWIAASLLTKIE